ncbi:SHOCT domain-containing protein [Paractinoplanes hotanensis]|uniref:SHOCT domain-containing protein n=1 Tax=Paractinoplanes hotanensis TaxID=2906497 RepID=A0ABT0YEF7_9ACTN|nr:SHOCT domain-containing protein [Actinoplanes hotanensis]MCM4084413.1 SHOCT domain-containing protein [Actinoplanes hotanensis]
MMYSHGGAAAWAVMMIALGLVLATAAAGLLITWARPHPRGPTAHDPIPDAERLLADRFARGEIDAEEYERRLHILRAARH